MTAAMELLVLSGRGIRVGVIGDYGLFNEHVTLIGAVAAARQELAAGHTCAFVAIRIEATFAHDPSARIGSGTERELARFEVYPDRVTLVPPQQGGLSAEQRERVCALPKKGLL